MKKFLGVALAGLIALVAVTLLATNRPAEANGGPDFKVTICHYDRNDTGPNAGPHTIEVAPAAVFGHLLNHTKNNDYIGDDSLGSCPEPTATPTPTATDTPTDTATPEPTATDTPEPTATSEVPTDTPTPPSVCTGDCAPRFATSTPVPPTATPTSVITTLPAVVTPAPEEPVAVVALPNSGDGSSVSDGDGVRYFIGGGIFAAIIIGVSFIFFGAFAGKLNAPDRNEVDTP